ncbi:YDG/SRA domain-containing protein [Streptomyces sp. NPDC091281]|uniref:YDG/SRA domain-containing protein n=1 Tax=Streptomyces sp. NPDC091281 TaxID=3365985 RepID=UPI003802698C
MGERKIGHIDGVVPGEVYPRRADVMNAQLHYTNQKGISLFKDEDGVYVADAIVLNGGYVDDHDEWTKVRYTGASPGVDKDPQDETLLVRSQSWEYEDNAALKLSYERGHAVRIIRGYKGDKRYSPAKGYRYDGLYRVTAIRTAVSKSPAPADAPIEICQFDLERLPEPEQEQTDVEREIAAVLEREAPDAHVSLDHDLELGPEPTSPGTRVTRVQRIVRDRATVQRVKALYDHECQMCGARLLGPGRKPYSEGAHLKPLGAPHLGPDVERNILCLCPNCHVRLDIGSVVIADDWSLIARTALFGDPLRATLKLHRQHRVHNDYVRYHREWWDAHGDAS